MHKKSHERATIGDTCTAPDGTELIAVERTKEGFCNGCIALGDYRTCFFLPCGCGEEYVWDRKSEPAKHEDSVVIVIPPQVEYVDTLDLEERTKEELEAVLSKVLELLGSLT